MTSSADTSSKSVTDVGLVVAANFSLEEVIRAARSLALAADAEQISGSLVHTQEISDERLIRIRLPLGARAGADLATWADKLGRALRQAQDGLIHARHRSPEVALVDLRVENQARLEPKGNEKPARDFLSEVRKSVASFPDCPAIQAPDGWTTYADLWKRVSLIQHALSTDGLLPGARAALVLPRHADLIASVLACWELGIVFSILDCDWPDARLQDAISILKPSAVITARNTTFSIPNASVRIIPDMIILEGAQRHSKPTVDPKEAAYVCFTSGSTGRPKGAILSRTGLNNYLEWAASTFASDRAASTAFYSSPAVDFSLTSILLPLTCGSRLTIPDQDGIMGLVGLIQAGHRFDFLKLTPTGLRILNDTLGEEAVKSAARTFILGGEMLGKNLKERLSKWHECTAFDEYGPTETVVGSVACQIVQGQDLHAGQIGSPISRTGLEIRSSSDTVLPLGVWGEICITGDGVGLGYLGDESATSRAFDSSSVACGGPVAYKTGDLGRIVAPDLVEMRGRIDGQIKHNGYRLEPDELSNVAEKIGWVRQAVPVQFGWKGGTGLALFVSCDEPWLSDETLSEKIRDHLAKHLPAYALPTIFVPQKAFPVARSGKLDLAAMKLIAAETQSRSARPSESRMSPVKSWIGACKHPAAMTFYDAWCTTLQVEDFGQNADFFALGGDSVRALRIVAQMRAKGWSLEFADFLRTAKFNAILDKCRPLRTETNIARNKSISPGKLTRNQSSMKALLGVFPKDWVTVWRGRTSTDVTEGLLRRCYHRLVRGCPVLTHAVGNDGICETHFFFVAKGDTHVEKGIAAARDWIDPDAGRLSALVAAKSKETSGFELHWMIHHAVVDLASWELLTVTLSQMLSGKNPPDLDGSAPIPDVARLPWNWHPSAPDFGPAIRWEPQRAFSGGALLALDHHHLNLLLQVAVGRAICVVTGQSKALVCGESHGRDKQTGLRGSGSTDVGWHTGYNFFEARNPCHENLLSSMARIEPGRGVMCHQSAGEEPDVAVNFLGRRDEPEVLGELDFHPHADGAVPLRIFPLQVNFWRDGEKIQSEWVYGSDRFSEGSLAAIFETMHDELSKLPVSSLPTAAGVGLPPPHVVAYALGSKVYVSPCHMEQVTVDFEGGMTSKDIRRAFEVLMTRHEALQTVVDLEMPAPRMRVLTNSHLPLGVVEAGNLADRDRKTERAKQDHLKRNFEAEALPYQITCIETPGENPRLIWTHHHSAFDGLSQQHLLREIVQLAEHHDLKNPPQPGAYFSWLKRRGNAWSQTVETDRKSHRGDVDGSRLGFGHLSVCGGRSLTQALREFSSDCGVPPTTALFLAWSTAAQSMGLVDNARPAGIMMAGRDPEYSDSEGIVGSLSFASGVPLLFARSATVASSAAVLALQMARLSNSQNAYDPGVAPGPAVLSVVSAPSEIISDGGTYSAVVDWTGATGGFSPSRVTGTVLLGERCTIRLSYHKAVLDGRSARRLAARFFVNLRRIVRNPEMPLNQLFRTEVNKPNEEAKAAEQGQSETVIAKAFSKILGIDAEIDDDFFSLGGHSLAALSLVSELEKTVGHPVKLMDLVKARSPRRLAAMIAKGGSGGSERVPVKGGEADSEAQCFPLTPLQQAYFVGRDAQFELGGVDAHLYAEFEFDQFDVGRARAALDSLIARHDMLRACVPDFETQHIAAQMAHSVEQIDLSDFDADEAEEKLLRLREKRAHSGRPPDVPPLFSITLVEMPNGVPTRILVSVSLIIGDAKSWLTLASEFTALYEGRSLPKAPEKHFSEYARDQIALRRSTAFDQVRRIADAMYEPPQLPQRSDLQGDAGQSDQAASSHRFVRRSIKLSAEQSLVLAARARELGVTQSVLLAAAFSEVLARFSENRSHMVNFTLYDRPPGFEAVVGDFTAPLLVAHPMKARIFADRVGELQDAVWNALDNRDVNGIDVLNEIGRTKGARQSALAPVVFTSTIDFQGMTDGDLMPAGCRYVWGIGQTPQVALDYQVHKHDGNIYVNWDSVDSVFADGIVDQMFAIHQHALEALTSGTETDWRRSIMPPLESPVREPEFDPSKCLHSAFLRQAEAQPDAVAITCTDRDLSYGALERESRLVATKLLASRVAERVGGSPATIGVLLDKGWAQCVAVLGILRAGAAFVPLDTGWPEARIKETLDQIDGAVICDRPLSNKCSSGVQAFVFDDFLSSAGEFNEAALKEVQCDPDELAYVIFTSGSTGQPKGVMISHAAATNTVEDVNQRLSLNADDCVFGLSALCFDLSIYDIFGSLSAGAKLALPDQTDLREPKAWLKQISKNQVTIWNSVPVLMDLVCDAAFDSDALKNLRAVLLSGDWVPPKIAPRIWAHVPECTITALGGATEAAIWSVFHDVEPIDEFRTTIPYGRALNGQWIAVCDEDFKMRPTQVVGEIVIGGAGVAMGYLGAAEKTRAHFPVNAENGERMYRTGDFGRLLESGEIEFLGRRDSQIKIAGNRVEVGEIQSIASLIQGVSAMIVLPMGERTQKRLVAFYTGRIDSTGLREEMAEILPSGAIPAELIRLEAFPLNDNGKIDRTELAQMATRRATAPPNSLPDTSHPDRGGSNKLHREVWELLKPLLNSEAPHHKADLLSLGMSSIDILRFLNALERRFETRISFSTFIADPTIEAISTQLSFLLQSDTQATSAQQREAVASDPWKNPVSASSRRLDGALAPSEGPQYLLHGVSSYTDDLNKRRSIRQYSRSPIPLSQFTEFLSCLRMVEREGNKAFFYPSAGGSYAIDVFVEVRRGRVEGLGAGLYLYDPKAHDLIVSTQGIEIHQDAYRGQSNQELIQNAAFSLFLVTKPEKTVSIYGKEAEELALLNAGYVGELLSRSGRNCGIGTSAAHGLNFDSIRHLFLDSAAYELVHLMFGGSDPDDERLEPDRERIVL